MTGDGMHAVFVSARDALDAAGFAQRQLDATEWGETEPLRVRMGVHTGETAFRDGDYFGSAVNRAARLMSIAHGGQVVLSSATAELVRESGLELRDLGEHRLAGLSRPEHVWQLCPPGLAREFPPLRSLDALPGNLPRQMTSFVGRDKDVAEIAALVRSRPLVTLTGVGGVGKTRLALEVAAEVITDFPDGAWLCELAPLTDPDAIWGTVAATFRVLPSPGRSLDESVLDYLRGKRLVLVLDNCEHVLDAVADMVVAIESRCPGVAVLATSREGLAVAGEQIVVVPSLGVPADRAEGEALAEAESVMLFCDRARSVRSDFALTHHNAAAVGVLCRRLDGIPLAIELAAARVRVLGPDDIVARLDQRFKLLTRGSRASLERHQTLRNTIDWSYDLLDTREREALNRLSVFAGGCDLQTAEVVLAGEDLDPLDVVDVLGQLVDKSLVLADPDEAGHIRYRLLETIRQYAQERLETSGEAPALRRRHADHFVAIAETAGPRLRSRDQLAWAPRMARETDNFRAALDWATEVPSADHALRLVASLMVSGIPIGYAALAWTEIAIDISGATDHLLFAEVASSATWSATSRGDLALAQDHAAKLDAAEARLGPGTGTACQGPAVLALFRGEFDLARSRTEEWVARSRRDGDSYELSNALTFLVFVQYNTGERAVARQTAEEALQVARSTGIPSTLPIALALVGTSLPPEEMQRALGLVDEAIQVGTQIGDPLSVANAVVAKGFYYAYRGDWDRALEHARDATDRITQAGISVALIGDVMSLTAVVVTRLGPARAEVAAILHGAGRHFAPGPGHEWPEQLIATAEAKLIDQLGQSRYETLISQGAELSADDALTTLTATLAAVRSEPTAMP